MIVDRIKKCPRWHGIGLAWARHAIKDLNAEDAEGAVNTGLMIEC